MKSRKRQQIFEAVQEYIGQDTEIEVKTEKRIYRIKIKGDSIILPSGKMLQIDARYII